MCDKTVHALHIVLAVGHFRVDDSFGNNSSFRYLDVLEQFCFAAICVIRCFVKDYYSYYIFIFIFL